MQNFNKCQTLSVKKIRISVKNILTIKTNIEKIPRINFIYYYFVKGSH